MRQELIPEDADQPRSILTLGEPLVDTRLLSSNGFGSLGAAFDDSFLMSVHDQHINPPGGDEVLGTFYGAVLEAISGNRPNNTRSFGLRSALKATLQGTQNTHSQVISSAFRGIVYLFRRLDDPSYLEFDTKDKWHEGISDLLEIPEHLDKYKEILRSWPTSTTLYSRYAGINALIKTTWGEKPISIADLGCGGNYGLRGMALGLPFDPLKADHTPGQIVMSNISKASQFESAAAYDQNDPDSPEQREWRLACITYPKEADQLSRIAAFDERVRGCSTVKFQQANIINDQLPKNSYDLVATSTVLYQIPPHLRQRVVNNALGALKEGGVLVIQDFATLDDTLHPPTLFFRNDWGAPDNPYRTFAMPKGDEGTIYELFQWQNGRCREVYPGQDFNKVINMD